MTHENRGAQSLSPSRPTSLELEMLASSSPLATSIVDLSHFIEPASDSPPQNILFLYRLSHSIPPSPSLSLCSPYPSVYFSLYLFASSLSPSPFDRISINLCITYLSLSRLYLPILFLRKRDRDHPLANIAQRYRQREPTVV